MKWLIDQRTFYKLSFVINCVCLFGFVLFFFLLISFFIVSFNFIFYLFIYSIPYAAIVVRNIKLKRHWWKSQPCFQNCLFLSHSIWFNSAHTHTHTHTHAWTRFFEFRFTLMVLGKSVIHLFSSYLSAQGK